MSTILGRSGELLARVRVSYARFIHGYGGEGEERMDRFALSDWRTFAWKYVVPLLIVGPVAYSTVLMMIGRVDWNGGPAPWFVRWIALAGLAAVVVLVRAVVGSLKRVRADGE